MQGKTDNAGQELSVFVKDGKQNKGKTVSKKCIATGMAGEELGGATPPPFWGGCISKKMAENRQNQHQGSPYSYSNGSFG